MTDALLAVGTSLVLGLISIRSGEYAYWRSWAQRPFQVSLLAMLVLYALAGLAGYAIFQALGPEPNALVAAAEGGAGHAALRAQLDNVGLGSKGQGRSVLSVIRDWLIEWMDNAARTAIRRRLGALSDTDLIGLTFSIFWEHVDPLRTDDGVTAQQHELLREAAYAVEGDNAEQADATGLLRGFCLREIESRRLTLEESAGG